MEPASARPYDGLTPESVARAYETVAAPEKLRLHGECHSGNILWTDQGPHFVDLDEARTGPADYSAWLARRWDDPAFAAAFPWLGTRRYWQDRILELREQIAVMQEPPLSVR